MQISAAITEKCIPINSSVNITDHGIKRVSTHMFWGWSGVIWCVSEKKSMQISAVITEKIISLHMSLKWHIVDNWKYHKIGLMSLENTNCVSNNLENQQNHFF